ncbi:MAG TPA: farnesyl diphosphate synthase [Pyrinomonadaceae bacterium]|nr:farnesyl diphosphate synthase [Pyrinomonadaceae bacterium]
MTTTDISLETSLREFQVETQELIDAELDRLIPSELTPPATVHSAIRWSVFAGGKRFRPMLLCAVGECFGSPSAALLPAACAVEMIHAYSLIHDDLPSMDDDDLRRGRATCHIRFGEAAAILAGDALQALAFKTVAEDENLSTEQRTRLVREIAIASGTPSGMVAGQALDLDAESRAVGGDELEQIHRLKTGALIGAAARCGAIIANATNAQLSVVSDYAAHLGLLFQITDDLLDVTASAEALGKTPGKDMRAAKATYVNIHGLDGARQLGEQVHARALATLEQLDQRTERLHAIADYILNRTT